MTIMYDEATDISYIEFSDDRVATSVTIADGVGCDLNEEGQLVGIEIEYIRDRYPSLQSVNMEVNPNRVMPISSNSARMSDESSLKWAIFFARHGINFEGP